MRTLVRVDNANCTYCMNEVRDELLARPLVHTVHMSAVGGCWEVEHDDDPSALTAVLVHSLHGWQAADNGEVIEVETNPTHSASCRWHGSAG